MKGPLNVSRFGLDRPLYFVNDFQLNGLADKLYSMSVNKINNQLRMLSKHIFVQLEIWNFFSIIDYFLLPSFYALLRKISLIEIFFNILCSLNYKIMFLVNSLCVYLCISLSLHKCQLSTWLKNRLLQDVQIWYSYGLQSSYSISLYSYIL